MSPYELVRFHSCLLGQKQEILEWLAYTIDEVATGFSRPFSMSLICLSFAATSMNPPNFESNLQIVLWSTSAIGDAIWPARLADWRVTI